MENALGLPAQYEHLPAYLLSAGAFGLKHPKTTSRAAFHGLLV
jgi:hypothetical protein